MSTYDQDCSTAAISNPGADGHQPGIAPIDGEEFGTEPSIANEEDEAAPPSQTGLKPEHLVAISMLLAGETTIATAETCGCSRSTLARWRKDPVFESYYRARLSELHDALKRQLDRQALRSGHNLLAASNTLYALLTDQNASAFVRNNAANNLIKESHRWIDALGLCATGGMSTTSSATDGLSTASCSTAGLSTASCSTAGLSNSSRSTAGLPTVSCATGGLSTSANAAASAQTTQTPPVTKNAPVSCATGGLSTSANAAASVQKTQHPPVTKSTPASAAPLPAIPPEKPHEPVVDSGREPVSGKRESKRAIAAATLPVPLPINGDGSGMGSTRGDKSPAPSVT
jgi:hypothetical protein